ncbi:hypothetical protein C8R46DRAFT_912121 [Mycena filopes]|nr:hypothetical protein C8R46DRAFT_912121 [Mycena filopes]
MASELESVLATSLVTGSHSPALLQLVRMNLTPSIIEYFADLVSEAIDYAMGRTRPSESEPAVQIRANFTDFVALVISRAEVMFPTILTALVYVVCARPHLVIAREDFALERVFLGALILAAKYTNDSTLKNAHWALCTGLFGRRDIARIEREFLEVLDWELGISEKDILVHAGLLGPSNTPF